jgi:Asp-tRNA(Asn)/Glu-tRNA(Gln) amidotransferase A subunit family amidase
MAEALWHQLAAQPATTPVAPLTAAPAPPLTITREAVRAAETLAGLQFSDPERDLMLGLLQRHLGSYGDLRLVELPNSVLPALRFSPALPGRTFPDRPRRPGRRVRSSQVVKRPATNAELAFLPVVQLAELLASRQVTSVELTRLYLDRLKRYDPVLNCVVNLTEERALRQAAAADHLISTGQKRGPLHGIPYGVKDLLAVPGYPTTWGAEIYRDRILDQTATVVERLDAAGAVLVAKLSMGELGHSDTWFRGTTMNPWQPTQGASGSSAGSAAAAAAGLVGFAVGHETLGSIITPATRNRITGLRPTFGRVSRHGAMVLAWSLDKIGPMARSVEDCAMVLDAIVGPDGRDPTVTDMPFDWDPDFPLRSIRVGYFKAAFDAPHDSKVRDDAALAALRELGFQLVPVNLPTDLPINALTMVGVEIAAALDEFTRNGGLDLLRDQSDTGWPNFVRASRFVPAVEYLQANRIRTLLMERIEDVFESVDVFIAPTFGVLRVTSFTGHPAIVLPNGTISDGVPASISLIGRLYGEQELCTVARAWQDRTGWHKLQPRGFAD